MNNPAPVSISAGELVLQADYWPPAGQAGLVIFAHGSGSSRHSSRNRAVAESLREGELGTLLLDLLTGSEEEIERLGGRLRFDIPLLAERLIYAVRWAHAETPDVNIGFFGASTGGGAALVAAAREPQSIRAVVSRGGRPDLAAEALPNVASPTLLIVGGEDDVVLNLNRQAYAALRCEKKLEIIPRATHLFEEPGAMEQVADLARDWFQQHLRPPIGAPL